MSDKPKKTPPPQINSPEKLVQALEQAGINFETDDNGNVKVTPEVVDFLESKEALHTPGKQVVKTKEELTRPPEENSEEVADIENKSLWVLEGLAVPGTHIINIVCKTKTDSKTVVIKAKTEEEATRLAMENHKQDFPNIEIEKVELHQEPNDPSTKPTSRPQL